MLQRDEAHLWVAGHQGLMLEVDLKKGVVSNKVIKLQQKFCSVTSPVSLLLLFWKIVLTLYQATYIYIIHISTCLNIILEVLL